MNEHLWLRMMQDLKLLVVRLDRDGNVSYLNPYFLELTGYKEEDIYGKKWFSHFLPENIRGEVEEVFRKTISGKDVPHYHKNVILAKSGKPLIVQWSNVTEYDESGEVAGTFSIGENVTELEQAIMTLQEERSRMDVILSSLNTGLALINHEMTVEWVNDSMRKLLFRGSAIGKKCYKLIGNRSEPCEGCQAALVFQDGRIHEQDFLNPATGHWYHNVFQPVKDRSGRVVKVLESTTDITEEKLTGEALRTSEEKFRGFFHHTPALLYIVSFEGIILDVNSSALKITGYLKDELVGKSFTMVYAPESLPKAKELFEQWQETGHIENEEVVIITKGGEKRTVLLSAGAVKDQNGNIIHSTSVQVDITELKRMEEARDQAIEELQAARDRLEKENIYLRKEIRGEHDFSDIIGKSNPLLYVLMRIKEVADTDSTVLIEGETGTGKERVALAIHKMSSRSKMPFVTVNCAALPVTLAESELFGHEPGAFTGAQRLRKGRFELAEGGTIFLDEIAEMPPELQVKLLRVLQNHEFERVGGTRTLKPNVRVIAATNHVLKDEVGAGRFRADLYYRLNVYPITMPPLRKRREDIPLLVDYFVKLFSERMGKSIDRTPHAMLEQFMAYDWPGNIRELMNVVERAVIVTPGSVLSLPESIFYNKASSPLSSSEAPPEGFTTLENHERQYIAKVLEATGWRVSGPKGAAKILGMNPSTLESRIKKFNIKK